jgi:hypothetical protein
MKTIGFGALLGVVIASLIIYWLHPLNAGAVGLIVTLSLSIGAIIVSWFAKNKSKEDEKSI